MSETAANSTNGLARNERRDLFLWPPAALLLIQWAVPPILVAAAPDSMISFFVGRLIIPIVCALGMIGWWFFNRRILMRDRIQVLTVYFVTGALLCLVGGKAYPIMAVVMYALPVVTSAWILWILLTQRMRWSVRLLGTMLAIGLSFLYFTMIRMEGVDGSFAAHFAWRWTPTAEDRLFASLSKSEEVPGPTGEALSAATVTLQPRSDDWLEFRGPGRDNRVPNITIETNWTETPPKELWRKPVGPGWSSFIVVDGRLYTQFQLGDEEQVVCWNAETGESIWTFRDKSRFEESIAGAGPRATPTYHNGRIYVTGGAGRVHCLDAVTGKAIWSRDLIVDGGRKMPEWGFAASPLIANDLVYLFAGGPNGKSLVAYRADTGEPAWFAGEGSNSYSSAQLVTLLGQPQILLSTDTGLLSVQPQTGETLWTHEWASGGAARIVQPALVSDTDLLIGTGMSAGGTRRIRVAQADGNWKTEEIWTTKRFKPYYNDFVVHEGHMYGFEGPIFMCVDVEKGERRWRERGYGNGQVLLLVDQKLLLILSEQGEIALVEANPERRQEITRIKAIEGKTWNHPVVAEGLLLVRNGEEAACYRLTTKGSSQEVTQTTSAP